MNAIKFKNFSDEDFSWKYDGQSYTFKAGQEMYLEDFKAHHFAKHLVDHVINKMEKDTGNQALRTQLLAQCFPPDEVVSADEALDIEMKKTKGKKSVKEVEEEFPDLEKPKKK